MNWISAIGWVAWGGGAVLALAFLLTFVWEREWRAAGLMLLVSLPALAVPAAVLLAEFSGKPVVVALGVSIGLAVVLAVALPVRRPRPLRIVGAQPRIDERDAVFHRFYRLRPGTPEFEAYYRDHPEMRAFDDEVRALPNLADPESKTYHRLVSPFQAATFDMIERITQGIDEWGPSPIEPEPVRSSPEEFTRRVKGFARYLGADRVGATRLNPAYVYSHIARGPGRWGAPITLAHSHAVAIAVEMDYGMVRHAPGSATTTETARKYLETARIAMAVARYIHLLGYEARAHVDGNYRVMCVPVAVEAGLGELGRLGLLITPEFGPRVRLSVVTTTLPLTQDEPAVTGVQEFCSICRKCADVCPSASVDGGEKAVCAGAEKWQTRRDTCYRFWRQVGSDCALCIRVCPYSNPGSPVHALVRRLIRRNPSARRLALRGDGFFYGSRQRTPRSLPTWHSTA